jgi:hypothetical protein
MARGSPGVVLCPEMGAGATGHVAVSGGGATVTRHVAAPELPCAVRWEPRDTRACAPLLPCVFDLKLVREGIRSSGTDNFNSG